ncbi:MAG: heme ABC exporter ATP-binding protein CcmA [Anaerolineae bacterium]|nr:heme ABC exporter ATP-binding protein CcmA [Anaerolineae bacterium]
MIPHILDVTNLVYHYGTLTVLDDLSFHLASGHMGLLVGQNGAGKTTLLRCLAGWTQVSKGHIVINGIACREQERAYRKQVIFVPDTPNFYDELTAWEHLQFVAQLHRLTAWQTRGTNLLQHFQLLTHKDTLPFTFSRGMRYKLALCLALLVQPPLLLLDEPFGPLDALAQQTLWQTLKQHTRQGGTVLFSSHMIPATESPDVVLHLRQGQIKTIEPRATTDLAQLLNDVV